MRTRAAPRRIALLTWSALVVVLGLAVTGVIMPRTSLAGPDTDEAGPADSATVVTVEGHAITKRDVDEAFRRVAGLATAGMDADRLAALRVRLEPKLEELLIMESLLSHAASVAGVCASDGEVARELEKVRRDLPEGDSLEARLRASGLSEAELKAQLLRELTINKLLLQQTAAVKDPGAEEVRAYYDQHQDAFSEPAEAEARHILIAIGPEDDAAAKAKKRANAEALQKELAAAKGEGFSEKAKERSACPSSARGGDLGRFHPGATVAAFDEAVFGRPVGEIGPVVETPFGYHIIQVTAREESRQIPFDEARGTIEARLRDEARAAAAREYLGALRAGAHIVRASAKDIGPAGPQKEGSDDATWPTDFDAARKVSQETGRPILANFTGSDWCPWCMKLRREVFATPAFRAWAAQNVVLLEVDFPHSPLPRELASHNDSLRKRYGVQGFPTVLFLSSRDASEIGRAGYAPGGPDAWIANARQVLAE